MNQGKMVEIWCYLHGMADGMITVSPRPGLAKHVRISVSMVNFNTSIERPQQILLAIPIFLAEGLGLYSRPMAPTPEAERPITPTAPAQEAPGASEFKASVTHDGNLHLHSHPAGEDVLDRLGAIRPLGEKLKREASRFEG